MLLVTEARACGNAAPLSLQPLPFKSKLTAARQHVREINEAMDELLKVTPQPASDVSESDFVKQDGLSHPFMNAHRPDVLRALERAGVGTVLMA